MAMKWLQYLTTLTILINNNLINANVITDFSNQGLKKISGLHIPSNTTKLNVSTNPLGAIPNGTFMEYSLPSVRELKLISTQLTDSGICRDSFLGMGTLTRVRIFTTYLIW